VIASREKHSQLHDILAPAIWRRNILAPAGVALSLFGDELFWRQFWDWQVCVMKMDKNMDECFMYMVIVS